METLKRVLALPQLSRMALLLLLLAPTHLIAEDYGGIGWGGAPWGSWKGAFDAGELPLAFEIRFTADGGALFSVPSQGVWLRPVESLVRKKKALSITVSDEPEMLLEGSLSSGVFAGIYRWGGQKAADFSARPASLPPRAGQAVFIKSGKVKLPGTLLLPATAGGAPAKASLPVVLFLSDSGPSDRDGNSFTVAGRSDCLLQLAGALADQGIASLRYDKRGSGESYLLGRKDGQLLFSDYVKDAQAALAFLKKDRRFGRITVVGHGEGALVGMAALGGANAQGFAALAASGRPAWMQVEEQLIAALPEDMEAAAWEGQWRPILESLKAGKPYAAVPDELQGVFRPSIQPYLISWFALDPLALMASFTGDTAILQGGNDLRTGPEDTSALEKAMPRARETFLPDMNHVLKEVFNIDLYNLGSYSDPAYPLASGLATVLADFAANGLSTPLPRNE